MNITFADPNEIPITTRGSKYDAIFELMATHTGPSAIRVELDNEHDAELARRAAYSHMRKNGDAEFRTRVRGAELWLIPKFPSEESAEEAGENWGQI